MITRKYLWRAGLLGILGVVVGACAQGMQRTPWPEVGSLMSGESDAGSREALERGRALYHGACVRCHAPVALDSLSPEDWNKVVPRMSRLSRFSPAQEADLADYVEASINFSSGSK